MTLVCEHTEKPKRLTGFDSAGEAFEYGGKIYRGIYPGNEDLYRDVLRICNSRDLFGLGVVPTWEQVEHPRADLPYELVLGHEKIPVVSYPHEWSAGMLMDAALLHIELFQQLIPHGLTLKDWHPFNILFKAAQPVFVDFPSIVPTEALANEAYLTPPNTPRAYRRLWIKHAAYLYEMHERMFVPYFLLPLALMHAGENEKARTRMRETILNAHSSVIQRSEVFKAGTLEHARNYIAEARLRWSLVGSKRGERFFKRLRSRLEDLSLGGARSDYLDYYESKGESFDFQPSADWTNKQRVVFDTLKAVAPKTVLDLASNTGWFAILAAKHGCEAVAFDIDEACVDRLYTRAKQEGLSILPLIMDFTRLTPAIDPMAFDVEKSHSPIDEGAPLIRSAEDRLKSDLVLALAIVHHLVLGKGMSITAVIEKMANFTNDCLIVEFVEKKDPLVVATPDFFEAFNDAPEQFEGYSLDTFSAELRKHFARVVVHPSSPESRFLCVCHK